MYQKILYILSRELFGNCVESEKRMRLESWEASGFTRRVEKEEYIQETKESQ